MQRRRTTRSSVSTALPADVGDRFLSELKTLLGSLDKGDYKVRYQNEELLVKYSDPTTTPAEVRREAAIKKWLSTELRNSQTNSRLYIGDSDLGWINSDDLLTQVRRLIARILGPMEYPAVIRRGNHTNGASTRVRRSPAAALEKLSGEVHISSSAITHWLAAFSGSRMSSQTLTLDESSVLFTVPKKSEIDRVACKEPEGNMLLQRSVGNHIRRRLRTFGIDLNDQTVNQELARVAVRQKLATIDLSSASDSISRQLVMNVLPWDWFSLLDDLRVKSTLVDGQLHELEMFSSMGNGFTFELESLIFYAVTRVVCWRSGVKGRISVYGDDIIAPAKIVSRLERVFHWLGFKMNPDKTHASGLFRESCGRHYYGGFDVTPFYVRRAIRELPDLINHLNHLLEWNGRGWGFFLDEEAYRFWNRWKDAVPEFLWGGIDPSDNTALVTGHFPRRRLVPLTREVRYSHESGYMYWLLSCECLDRRDALEVDPRLQIGWKSRPVNSLGERTTWSPGLAFS